MYATRTRKVKTDRRDALALAEACLLGAYRPAHRLSDPQRQVRGRLAVRDALVRTRTRYISLSRALLRQHGYRIPSGSAEGFLARVRALALPGHLRSLIAPLLAVMRHLNHQLAYSDEVIDHISTEDARVQRLRTVPSIGPVTAAAFVAAIDDVGRFRHAYHLEAYLGLVPKRVQLGRDPAARPDHQGGLGPPALATHFQAAVSILRRRPPEAAPLWTWALRIAARRGKQIAVVALARRVAGILYALLRDGSVFTAHGPRHRRAAGSLCPGERSTICSLASGLSQARWVGERECCLGRRRRAAA